MDIHHLLRPRAYANDILALPNRQRRKASLALVPEPIRDWVAFYVTDHFWRRAGLNKAVRS